MTTGALGINSNQYRRTMSLSSLRSLGVIGVSSSTAMVNVRNDIIADLWLSSFPWSERLCRERDETAR